MNHPDRPTRPRTEAGPLALDDADPRQEAASRGDAPRERGADEPLLTQVTHCIAQVARLLRHRRLHLHHDHIGELATAADGRTFTIYRESSSSEPHAGEPLSITMWFRLRWVPPGARVRAFLFERESILNTVLYAGFEGYRTKLWTVNHVTNDYAGFYTWRGRAEAERYSRYAMRMLRPLCVPGSLGFTIQEDAPADAR